MFDIKTLSRIIFVMHDKPERVRALHAVRLSFNPRDIAEVFGQVWTNSENLFQVHNELGELIRFVHAENVGHLAMDSQERQRFRHLKEKASVTLYRGGAEHNVSGYSWTTSKDVATFFANRYAMDGKPLIAKTVFSTNDIIAYFRGRDEREVVVDISSDTAKASIELAEIIALPEVAASPMSRLQWGVQAYGVSALGNNDERLKTNVIFARVRGMTLAQLINPLEESIALLSEFGTAFRPKIDELQHEIDLYAREYDLVSDEVVKHLSAGATFPL